MSGEAELDADSPNVPSAVPARLTVHGGLGGVPCVDVEKLCGMSGIKFLSWHAARLPKNLSATLTTLHLTNVKCDQLPPLRNLATLYLIKCDIGAIPDSGLPKLTDLGMNESIFPPVVRDLMRLATDQRLTDWPRYVVEGLSILSVPVLDVPYANPGELSVGVLADALPPMSRLFRLFIDHLQATKLDLPEKMQVLTVRKSDYPVQLPDLPDLRTATLCSEVELGACPALRSLVNTCGDFTRSIASGLVELSVTRCGICILPLLPATLELLMVHAEELNIAPGPAPPHLKTVDLRCERASARLSMAEWLEPCTLLEKLSIAMPVLCPTDLQAWPALTLLSFEGSVSLRLDIHGVGFALRTLSIPCSKLRYLDVRGNGASLALVRVAGGTRVTLPANTPHQCIVKYG